MTFWLIITLALALLFKHAAFNTALLVLLLTLLALPIALRFWFTLLQWSADWPPPRRRRRRPF